MEASGQLHAPTALPRGKNSGKYLIGRLLSLREALDISEIITFRVSGNEPQIAQTEAQTLRQLSSPGGTTQMQYKCRKQSTI